MKTILAIDDDVLVAAMAIAQADGRELGEIISDLARRSLHDQPILLPMRPSTTPISETLGA